MSIRVTRRCAICTEVPIMKQQNRPEDPLVDKVCTACRQQWKGQEQEPWFLACLEESNKEHNLKVQSYRHESPLSVAENEFEGGYTRNFPWVQKGS